MSRKTQYGRTLPEKVFDWVMALGILALMVFVFGPIGEFLHAKVFPPAPSPTREMQYAAPFPRPSKGDSTPSPTPRAVHHAEKHFIDKDATE